MNRLVGGRDELGGRQQGPSATLNPTLAMPDIARYFREPLMPAIPAIQEFLGIGRSAAYTLLREYDTEFKRQRGVNLPKSGRNHVIKIDRDRLELLRTIHRDFKEKRFGSYADAIRYHLNPGEAYTPDFQSLSDQLRKVQGATESLTRMVMENRAEFTRLSMDHAELRDAIGEINTNLASMREDLKWFRETYRQFGELLEEAVNKQKDQSSSGEPLVTEDTSL